jgi:hypothetical protein
MRLSEINRNIKRYENLISEYNKLGQDAPAEYFKNLNNWNKSLETYMQQANLAENDGELGAPYIPESKAPRLNVEVPDNMDEETHEIIDRVDAEVGGIDEYVRKKLHFKTIKEMYADPITQRGLSAEQIDAIGLAIYNIEMKNQFMIISDQTGIGKGRIAAAILRYAHFMNKKPIFLTIRANLFSDMYRDLYDIYMDDMHPEKETIKDEDGNPVEYEKTRFDKDTGEMITEIVHKYKKVKPKKGKKFIPFILNHKTTDNDPSIKNKKGDIVYEIKGGASRKTEYEKVIKDFDYGQYDCFMATYSQFTKDAAKLEFLDKIVKDNIIVLDESHIAGGEGIRAQNIKSKIEKALGGIFLSATYAKFPKNMPIYAQTTAIKYANLSDSEFVTAITAGGNALQEVVSAKLVEAGCLIRRQRPLSNIKFNYISIDQDGHENYGVNDKEIEHNAIFDNITYVLRNIIEFQKTHITPYIQDINDSAEGETTNEASRQTNISLSYKNAPMFNRLFQIVNQTVFSLKAEEVANRAIQRLKNGKKPVITFENTMGAWLERLKEMYGNETIETDFSEVLKRGLETVMEYSEVKEIKITEKDENGDEVTTTKKATINLTINPEDLPNSGREMYYKLRDKIKQTKIGVSISPVDVIKKRIQDAGYTVGEITGRSLYVDFSDNNYVKGRIKKRKKENATDVARLFNYNEIDCVMLNTSGSTGISLHSKPEHGIVEVKSPEPPISLFPKNEVKQRVMIVSQPNLDINSMVQTWGRVNRSGQAYLPEYDILTLSVPAEQRLLLFLQRKLRSLDANTASNQKENTSVLNMEDFMNVYGDEIVLNWTRENADLDEMMDKPCWKRPRYPITNLNNTPDGALNVEIGLDKYGNEAIVRYETMEEAALTTSGRVAILPVKDQSDFYNTVNETFKAKVRELKENDQYDLEVQSVPLNAKLINRKVSVHGVMSDNPFAGDVVVEECEVDILDKPMSKVEIKNVIEKNLQDKTPDGIQNETIDNFLTHIEKRKQTTTDSLQKRLKLQLAEIKEMPSIKRILEKEGKEAWKEAVSDREEKVKIDYDIKVNKLINDTQIAKDKLLPYFQYFKIGQGYIVDYNEELKKAIFGALINIKINYEQTNPFAPSNIEFVFARTTGHPRFSLQPTDAGGIDKLEKIKRVSSTYYDKNKLNNLVENWDNESEKSDSDREIRYIVTGNILAAMKDSSSKRIIQYTYEDGTTNKGILLPKDHKEKMEVEIPLKYMKKSIEELEYGKIVSNNQRVNDGSGWRTTNNGITFTGSDINRVRVSVSKSAKNGAKYFKNDSLIRILENYPTGFYDMGNPSLLEAYLDREKVGEFLDVLHYEFSPAETIKIATALYDILVENGSIPKSQSSENRKEILSKIIKLEAKYTKISNMAQVAGLSGLNKEDEKVIDDFNKYLDKKGLNQKKIPALSGIGDARKIAKKHNIDLDNINI